MIIFCPLVEETLHNLRQDESRSDVQQAGLRTSADQDRHVELHSVSDGPKKWLRSDVILFLFSTEHIAAAFK